MMVIRTAGWQQCSTFGDKDTHDLLREGCQGAFFTLTGSASAYAMDTSAYP